MLLVAALLTGCAGGGAEKGILNSWVGSHVNEVINQWGPPQGETLVAGRKYYKWGSSQSAILPAQTYGTATVIGNTAY
jgi:hypothetical protein